MFMHKSTEKTPTSTKITTLLHRGQIENESKDKSDLTQLTHAKLVQCGVQL